MTFYISSWLRIQKLYPLNACISRQISAKITQLHFFKRHRRNIVFSINSAFISNKRLFSFAILRLLSYHYEIEINFYNDNFPHSVSDIIYCSKLVPHYILAKNRQAGKTVRLSLNLGEGHGT